ncbi:MAG: conjugative transfer signal peptidase TraF [Magnetospirillum sp.]|nr:conjugative transfer signal peptidase TraF [Magnetospirillum sp.]
MRELLRSGVITSPPRCRGRNRPRATLALGLAGLGLIGFAALADPAPRLVWNATASAPLGLYYRVSGPVRRGDLVLAWPPAEAAHLATERGYLPAGVPLIKRVAALAGDEICGLGAAVTINGHVAAERLAADARGRTLPAWQGCRRLGAGEVFLLMKGVSGSFDGRYFGPVPADTVIGRLVALWTW